MADAMIPITMFIVLGFAVLAYFYWNYQNRVTIMKTVEKAMDQGKELTPELLVQLGAAGNPRIRDMRRGVVFLSLGIAGILCSLFFTDADVVNGIRAGAVFPLMLGFGFLLVWKLNRD
jgi:hypothetical protein